MKNTQLTDWKKLATTLNSVISLVFLSQKVVLQQLKRFSCILSTWTNHSRLIIIIRADEIGIEIRPGESRHVTYDHITAMKVRHNNGSKWTNTEDRRHHLNKFFGPQDHFSVWNQLLIVNDPLIPSDGPVCFIVTPRKIQDAGLSCFKSRYCIDVLFA